MPFLIQPPPPCEPIILDRSRITTDLYLGGNSRHTVKIGNATPFPAKGTVRMYDNIGMVWCRGTFEMPQGSEKLEGQRAVLTTRLTETGAIILVKYHAKIGMMEFVSDGPFGWFGEIEDGEGTL